MTADLDALVAAEAASPAATFWLDPPGLGCWGMAPWQRAVATDPSRRTLIRKGNKVGGSCLAHWTIKAFLGGWHPVWHRPRRRARVLYVAADLEGSYRDDVSARQREFFLDADLSARCRYDEVRGYMVGGARGIETAAGDGVIFRSGTQATLAAAGVSADLVIINEPPRQHIWAEVMRAAAEWTAPVLVNFTPLPPESMVGGDDLGWLRKQLADPAGGWSEHVVPLRQETAPHRTAASIAQQVADMFPWERAQRRDAAWEGPAPDRRFGNFDDACVFRGGIEGLPGLRPDEQIRIGLGADHGELTGREAWVLAAYVERAQDPRAWVLDAYISQGRTTVEADAHAVAAMLSRHGLDLAHVDRAVGDVNSAGKSSPFRRVNTEFEAAFAALGHGLRVQTARKGPGSVVFGVRVLDESFGRRTGVPSLMVHEDCEPVLTHVRRWSGAKDGTEHVGDAMRYLLVPILGQAWSWGRGVADLPLTAPTSAPAWLAALGDRTSGRASGRRGGGDAPEEWDGGSA